MTTLFSQDSALMRGMSYLTDAVWLTILTVVACLPVVTIGAAWCASYETARTLGSGEGHMTRRFADAFRSNLVKATGLWLVMGVTGAAIAASWVFIQITPLLVVKFAATILWAIMAVWVWPLQARFENPVGRTLRNAPAHRYLPDCAHDCGRAGLGDVRSAVGGLADAVPAGTVPAGSAGAGAGLIGARGDPPSGDCLLLGRSFRCSAFVILHRKGQMGGPKRPFWRSGTVILQQMGQMRDMKRPL